jgi:hypothetical protein
MLKTCRSKEVAEFWWVQYPLQINADNLNNVRCRTRRLVRNMERYSNYALASVNFIYICKGIINLIICATMHLCNFSLWLICPENGPGGAETCRS